MASKLIDCLVKAEAAGLFTEEGERKAILARAHELSKTMGVEQGERAAVEEAKKTADKRGRKTSDKIVLETPNVNVAYAGYMEEMQKARQHFISTEAAALATGRREAEGRFLGKEMPQEGQVAEPPDVETPRRFLATLQRSIPRSSRLGLMPQQKPSADEQLADAMAVGKAMSVIEGMGRVTATNTVTVWEGAPERSVQMTWDASSDSNLAGMVNELAREAGKTKKDLVVVSRQLEPNEDNPNMRPGLDIIFAEPMSLDRLDGMLQFLRARGITGATLTPHEVSIEVWGEPQTFSGITLQIIPELAKIPVTDLPDTLVDLSDELHRVVAIKDVIPQSYDTLVLTGEDYDARGISRNAVGAVRAAAWAERSYNAINPAAGKERAEAAKAPSQGLGATAQKVAPSRELESAAALVAAGKAAPEVALPIYSRIFNQLLELQRQHRAVIAGREFAPEDKPGMVRTRILQAIGELDTLLRFLPPEVRGKVGGFFQAAKAAESEKQLTRFFRERITKMAKVFEAHLKKEFSEAIHELLKSAKAKTVEGIKRGGMTPTFQHVVDKAIEYSKMTADEVAIEKSKVDAIASDPKRTEEERETAELELATLDMFGNLKERTAKELEGAYNWLQYTVQTGRTMATLEREGRKEKREAGIAELVSIMGKADQPGLSTVQEKMEQGRHVIGAFYHAHKSFFQFFDMIFPGSSVSADFIERERLADNAQQDMRGAAILRFKEAYHNAIGAKGWWAVGKAQRQLKKVHKMPWKVGEDGVTKTLYISKLEAIQHVLAWDQPDVQKKMREGSDYDDAKMADIAKLIDDPVSQGILNYLREEYARLYALINPTYRALYGIDMPSVEFYAPTHFHAGASTDSLTPWGGAASIGGITPTFLFQRVSHKAQYRKANALTAYWQHIDQVSHFINWAPLLRDMRGVILDSQVQNSILQKYGGHILNEVNFWIDRLAKGGRSKADEIGVLNMMVDAFGAYKSAAALSGNVRSWLMQTDSGMRFVNDGRVRTMIPSLTNVKKLIETLPKAWASNTVQRRIIQGANPQVKAVFDRANTNPGALLELTRLGLLPMQYFDAYLTTLSAAVSYQMAHRDAQEQGLSEAEAEAYAADKMDDAVYRYSQPIGVGNRSLIEQSHGLYRFYMLFLSDPRLKQALFYQGWREIAKGSISKGARMILFVELSALLAQLIRNVYDDWTTDKDDEDIWTTEGWIHALLAAPVGGFMLVNSAFDFLISKLLGEKAWIGQANPFADMAEQGARAAKNFDDLFQTEDPQAFLKELGLVARSAALLGPFSPQVAGGAAALSAVTNFLKATTSALVKEKETE